MIRTVQFRLSFKGRDKAGGPGRIKPKFYTTNALSMSDYCMLNICIISYKNKESYYNQLKILAAFFVLLLIVLKHYFPVV